MGYIVGLARNARLHAAVELAEAALADAYQASRTKQRLIGEFAYAAKSWPYERRVITRLEFGDQGTNPRFVVTNLQGEPQALYDGLYCQRGEAENRIKEAQLDLFGTRASCSQCSRRFERERQCLSGPMSRLSSRAPPRTPSHQRRPL